MNDFSFKLSLLWFIVSVLCFLPTASSFQLRISQNNELSTTTDLLKGNDLFKSSNSSGCPQNCNSHGQCEKDKCYCYYFYSGDACQNRWREDKSWYAFWTFYFLLVIFMHVIGMAWCSWNLYCMRHKLDKTHWSKWPISAYLMIMFIVASFIRVLCYSIDPHNEREIIGNIADAILFNISIILWLSGGCLMFLYWIEIQRVSHIAALNSVQKLRPVLLGFIGVIAIVILPASIVAYVTNIAELILIYNLFLTLVFIGFIILLTLAGLNLIRVLREMTKFKNNHGTTSPASERETIFHVFLSKLSWLIMSLDAILVALIVTLAVFEGVDARRHKWSYIIIHLFLRLEEMAVVVCTNMFVMRKKPRGVDGTLTLTTIEEPIDPNVRISLPRSASEKSQLWE